MSDSNFYKSLSSKESLGLHIANTICNFIVEFPEKLSLLGD